MSLFVFGRFSACWIVAKVWGVQNPKFRVPNEVQTSNTQSYGITRCFKVRILLVKAFWLKYCKVFCHLHVGPPFYLGSSKRESSA